MSPPPPYIPRDDDWAFPGPVALAGSSAQAWPFLGDAAALATLCQSYSIGGVTVEPWLPLVPLVIVFASASDDIQSLDPVYNPWGRLSEREVGVFVPVVVTKPGAPSFVALLCPYLFVDNGATMVCGREAYGIPKELATFPPWPFAGRIPLPLTVTSLALPQQGDLATMSPILTVTELLPAIAPPPIQPWDPRQLLTDLWSALLGGGISVPLVVLKQFRAIESGSTACYQALACCQIEPSITSVSVDLGAWALTMPPYFFPKMANTLGLANGTTTLACVIASLDFKLSLGVILAP